MSTRTDQHNDFGANEWYIQELYLDYLKDPASVPEKWRDFLADYHPEGAAPTPGNGAGSAAPAIASVTAPPAAAATPPPAD